MKIITQALLGLVLASSTGLSQAVAQQPVEPQPGKTLCLISGIPPSDYPYATLKKLKAAKGTYGSIDEVSGRLIEQARAYGADAVINYEGSQRFGFWPWRIVRPVVRGTAIRWTKIRPNKCTVVGGFDASDLTAPSESAPQQDAASVSAEAQAVAPAAGGSDLQGRLKDLKQAHEQGLITQEEYESRKKALLDKL